MTLSPRRNLKRNARVSIHHIRSARPTSSRYPRSGDTSTPAGTSHRQHLHLANEAVLVHRPPLLAPGRLGHLGPHLLHVLEHHVAVAVKRLDARQQLPVVAHGDEDLGVRPHGSLEDRERARGELVLFDLGDLVFPMVTSGFHRFREKRSKVRLGAQQREREGESCKFVGGRWLGGDVRELVPGLREKFSAEYVSGGGAQDVERALGDVGIAARDGGWKRTGSWRRPWLWFWRAGWKGTEVLLSREGTVFGRTDVLGPDW
jgi:hypothetical protein